AVMQVYRATGDRAFLAEMYDKLVRYHRWWFAARDHDRNGLAEYGATDGTAIAAKWESGMDNAVRFDGIAMLANGKDAWSMDQESVDLNAYLYKEATQLAYIADVLGKPRDKREWQAQAATMKHAIRSRMYDPTLGWFFDAKLGSREFVRVYGSEGWAPLWAGVATPAQAAAVEKTMMDPRKFATAMPFPTLAADDPHFAPIKGYWRGPVWLDQSLFGVEALRRYGYRIEADAMARRLVLAAKGLATGQATFRENYAPLTGTGYQSRNFSWSAASFLLLLRMDADTQDSRLP
ncbi:MAG TPA: trehalase family glycosidase, partial [Rhodanobacter sp.]